MRVQLAFYDEYNEYCVNCSLEFIIKFAFPANCNAVNSIQLQIYCLQSPAVWAFTAGSMKVLTFLSHSPIKAFNEAITLNKINQLLVARS